MRELLTLDDVERRLGLQFPDRHRQAMLDPADQIHEESDFLLVWSPYELLRILDVNDFLKASDYSDWPPFLVAFASNGCGDYYAYDLRGDVTRILYIDPDYTIAENLTQADKLEFNSFEAWYQYRFEHDLTG